MRDNKVKALTDLEHVRLRPGMYVGSVQLETLPRWTLEGDKFEYKEVTFVPGLLKLFDEIVSNSIDEAIRTDFRFANKISIEFAKDSILVEDNGRGIPVTPSEDFPSKTHAEVALTHLRAGGNFGAEEVVSIGSHGLGASLVNILSRRFDATTSDGKKVLIMASTDGPENTKIQIKPSKNHGTIIRYFPDFKHFGVQEMNGDLTHLLKKRVFDLAANFPKIEFRVDDVVVKAKKFKDYVGMVGETYVLKETSTFKVAVLPSEDPQQISFVNGIDTYEGGTHLDLVRNKIVNALWAALEKKYKKLGIKGADVRAKLTFVVMSSDIKSPKFRSQTKEYLSNSPADFAGVFDGVDDPKFIKTILNTPAIIDPIIETKKLRIEAAEAVRLKAASKNLKKIRVPKHIPANGPPMQASLFITEGDSASGPFTLARDPLKHGCFPLRGKPMNVHGKKAFEIVENKEISQLMSILGLRFGASSKETKLNYGHIKIMADADYDGFHIASLMLVFFMNWPWLFEEKRITIVRCPIMKMTKGKQIIRIYDLARYQTLVEAGTVDKTWTVSYMKGLGSLTADEYSLMINTPVEDVIELTDDSDRVLDMAFGGDADKRKVWLQS